MTVDKIMSVIAPFRCLTCLRTGVLLCEPCEAELLERLPSRCYRCHATTAQSTVCASCRKQVRLEHVWVSFAYTGLVRELIDLFKFERAGAASIDIARMMSSSLPLLPTDSVICYVPTTLSRRRVRGYDQAELLAKEVSKNTGLPYYGVIQRLSSSRQVGASRSVRKKQAEEAFSVTNIAAIQNKTVLIVDDVTTTGASIEVVAKLLKKAGARHVSAVVFAQAM